VPDRVGTLTTFTNIGGVTSFIRSSAGDGTFINMGASIVEFAGETDVRNGSTVADGTFIINGGSVAGAGGGKTAFSGFANAEAATLIANGGTGGGEGGQIVFANLSKGGTARIELFGNGTLDISTHLQPRIGVTVGSIEGDGIVFLGAGNLGIGSNNLNTTFSGVIQDDGLGGSLTKVGSGTLILSGTNTYTGNTNVRGGVLEVDGSIMSNTFVNRGATLAGIGTINGNVSNNGMVSPGSAGAPGVLTVVHNYTQAQYATLMIQIAGASAGQVSLLDVLGTANLSGQLDPVLLNGFVPTIGETFTFLNYGAVNGTLFIFNPNIDNLPEHWEVSYFPTNAILSVVAGNVTVPDQGSTLLLLTLGLLGLVTFRQQLVRKQS
jgi:autotransporter-associated beta strand protein